MRGSLIVISGPSGAGKGTVLSRLDTIYYGLTRSISVTTRAPRKGEVEGVHYFFRSDKQFDEMLSRNEFLETANVYDKRYGTPAFYVDKLLSEGKDVVLEIDTVGALNVKAMRPEAILIFLAPPSFSALKDRLVGRGTESEEQISLRLSKTAEEIAKSESYDYIVINDEVDMAAEHLRSIIVASHLRTVNNTDFIKDFMRR